MDGGVSGGGGTWCGGGLSDGAVLQDQSGLLFLVIHTDLYPPDIFAALPGR